MGEKENSEKQELEYQKKLKSFNSKLEALTSENKRICAELEKSKKTTGGKSFYNSIADLDTDRQFDQINQKMLDGEKDADANSPLSVLSNRNARAETSLNTL